jgi:hypothetical protein
MEKREYHIIYFVGINLHIDSPSILWRRGMAHNVSRLKETAE